MTNSTGEAFIGSGSEARRRVHGYLQRPDPRVVHRAKGAHQYAAAGAGRDERPQFVEAARALAERALKSSRED